MNKVLQCVISAAIGGAVAFFPALTVVRTHSAFAAAQEILAPETQANESDSDEPVSSGTESIQPVGTGESLLALGLPASESPSETASPKSAAKTPVKTVPKGATTAASAKKQKCAYHIVIESLNIENCIQDHAAHDLSTPSKASGKVANISVGSSRFIYGHNSVNIFKQLGKIQNGAVVKVITPSKTEKYRVNLAKSGKNFDYRCLYAGNTNRIAGVADYRAANCAKLISMASLVYGQTNSLSLMTCAGSYESALGTYNRRQIIIAEKF
jgi:hypothetical protein